MIFNCAPLDCLSHSLAIISNVWNIIFINRVIYLFVDPAKCSKRANPPPEMCENVVVIIILFRIMYLEACFHLYRMKKIKGHNWIHTHTYKDSTLWWWKSAWSRWPMVHGYGWVKVDKMDEFDDFVSTPSPNNNINNTSVPTSGGLDAVVWHYINNRALMIIWLGWFLG